MKPYNIHSILIFFECNGDGPDGLIAIEEVAPTLRHSTIGDGNNGRVADGRRSIEKQQINQPPLTTIHQWKTFSLHGGRTIFTLLNPYAASFIS